MHHKRGRAKNQRAGCLLCKPHKMNGAGGLKNEVHKIGFGRLRGEAFAAADLSQHELSNCQRGSASAAWRTKDEDA
jgi:hypothetical protein